jgi:replicative DNA helicase
LANELFNIEAEQFFLASALRYPKDYWDLNEVGLVAADFVGTDNKRVARAIFEVVAEKNEPDLPLVVEELKLQGDHETVEYASSLSTVPCSVKQAKEYSRIVKSLAVSRALGHFGAKTIEISQSRRTDYETALSEVEGLLRGLSRNLPETARSPKPEDILRRLRLTRQTDHIPINFSPTMQAMTGGFYPGHFWVVGGFSSTGKSAFACNVALDAMLAPHKRIAIVSAEMTQEQYIIRMMSILSGVPQNDIRNNVTIGLDKQKALHDAEDLLSRSNLYVYEDIYTMPKIRAEMQRLKNRDGLDLFILDYIQNVSVTGDEVSDAREVALECQRLAKDLDCTVFALSQLSNAQAKYELEGGDENYYSLKGHGAIRDAADEILTLHRDRKNQSPVLKVKWRKNRHGPMSDFDCRMDLVTGGVKEEYFADDYD